jgi:hypothetical protein
MKLKKNQLRKKTKKKNSHQPWLTCQTQDLDNEIRITQ